MRARRWLFVPMVIALMAVPAVASASEASDSLVVIPAIGDVQSAISLSTVGMCARGTSYMVTVNGRGIRPTDGGDIIVGAADLKWLEPTGYPSHTVSVSVSLERFFQRASVKNPRGEYVFTFICRNRLDIDALQTFAATISVDAKGNYQAQGISALDLSTAIEKADVDFVLVPGTERAEIGEPAAPDVDNTEELGSAAPSGSDDSLRITFLIGGALLLAGAISAWIVLRRRDVQESNT